MTLPLEKQVTSLELSRELKELGVPQESLYYHWVHNAGAVRGELYGTFHNEPYNPKEGWRSCSAFTVAELIELLGDKFGVLERFPYSGKFGAYIPNDIGTSATGVKVADVLAELLLQTYGNEEN